MLKPKTMPICRQISSERMTLKFETYANFNDVKENINAILKIIEKIKSQYQECSFVKFDWKELFAVDDDFNFALKADEIISVFAEVTIGESSYVYKPFICIDFDCKKVKVFFNERIDWKTFFEE